MKNAPPSPLREYNEDYELIIKIFLIWFILKDDKTIDPPLFPAEEFLINISKILFTVDSKINKLPPSPNLEYEFKI